MQISGSEPVSREPRSLGEIPLESQRRQNKQEDQALSPGPPKFKGQGGGSRSTERGGNGLWSVVSQRPGDKVKRVTDSVKSS